VDSFNIAFTIQTEFCVKSGMGGMIGGGGGGGMMGFADVCVCGIH
jgi:hypothetical protein